jgi:phage shock protein A
MTPRQFPAASADVAAALRRLEARFNQRFKDIDKQRALSEAALVKGQADLAGELARSNRELGVALGEVRDGLSLVRRDLAAVTGRVDAADLEREIEVRAEALAAEKVKEKVGEIATAGADVALEKSRTRRPSWLNATLIAAVAVCLTVIINLKSILATLFALIGGAFHDFLPK